MNELKQSMEEHHAFIARTDRKSLYTQLKNLVQQAQEVASKELNHRRNSLKLLLESEDKIYEEEFANNVKSRIDEDIKERKDNLLKIKEENSRKEQEFLKSKRIQQFMSSCYEIREALRGKDMQNIRECQLQQMLENERAARREQDLEKYWLKVQDINLKAMDEYQNQENCLKTALVKNVAKTRQLQLQELQQKREKECQEKLAEKHKINALVEQLRLEEFDRKMQRERPQVAEYRKDLLKMIKDKEEILAREKEDKAEEHRNIMREVEHLAAEESKAVKEKKQAFYTATMDFIKFVKGVRQLEEQKQQMMYSRIDELRRIDLCTKSNLLLERQRKARIAEQCFAALRQQICEQYQRRLREEAEYRENKILENRFIHNEITRAEIVAKREEFRKVLNKQIEEIKKIREAEEAKFSQDLKRASNDPEYCAELAEKYIKEAIDYLQPHPNWYILACPPRDYVPKPPARSAEDLMKQGATPKKCLESCAAEKAFGDGRGDENVC